MGCYIYSVRRSDPVIAQLDEGFVDVYRLQYLSKPYYERGQRDRITGLHIGRAYHAWEKEDLTGRYVVFSGKRPAPGDRVYRMQRHLPVWNDCSDKGPGEFIGVIEGEPLRWRIRRMTTEEYRHYCRLREIEEVRHGRVHIYVDGRMQTGPEVADQMLAQLA